MNLEWLPIAWISSNKLWLIIRIIGSVRMQLSLTLSFHQRRDPVKWTSFLPSRSHAINCALTRTSIKITLIKIQISPIPADPTKTQKMSILSGLCDLIPATTSLDLTWDKSQSKVQIRVYQDNNKEITHSSSSSSRWERTQELEKCVHSQTQWTALVSQRLIKARRLMNLLFEIIIYK